jgi:hypothetical protein
MVLADRTRWKRQMKPRSEKGLGLFKRRLNSLNAEGFPSWRDAAIVSDASLSASGGLLGDSRLLEESSSRFFLWRCRRYDDRRLDNLTPEAATRS